VSEDTFAIGDDIMDLLDSMADVDAVWSVLLWAKSYNEREGKEPHLPDLMREKPQLFPAMEVAA
jgi:hypothetical protein